jgi:4-hydroxyproline epimerase
MIQRLHTIDSHTGGEPTRVVVAGMPDLGKGSLSARLERFQSDFDHYRRAIILEPRGHPVIVGALLCEPEDPSCVAGVIFFNDVGYLGMCGHGLIGLITTLVYQGKITAGDHRIETPVGVVTGTLHSDGQVSVRNVLSYRTLKNLPLNVPEVGNLTGDVAWGGNWFFLVADHGLSLTQDRAQELTAACLSIRDALVLAGHPEVDHVELFGPPTGQGNDSRSFVMCPGGAYDRSPCGTGTSAKLACLAADGKLAPGQLWRQESIVGSVFEGSYEAAGEGIIPTITGQAYITAEGHLVLDPTDPFRWGLV